VHVWRLVIESCCKLRDRFNHQAIDCESWDAAADSSQSTTDSDATEVEPPHEKARFQLLAQKLNM
jgi:hypothetical protein